jgi:hypothetical protein
MLRSYPMVLGVSRRGKKPQPAAAVPSTGQIRASGPDNPACDPATGCRARDAVDSSGPGGGEAQKRAHDPALT